mmetsp:Transcript_83087/g.144309  ORF Transcript_83087/g.144309 Transcript_83087/m.144309 type:complete len:588 (-) Transcript_83087:82-1845(-)
MGGGKWKVVGGADKGGILVREGQGTSSTQCEERLATGSLVEEVELVGERLHFKRISGAGPAEGWVSIKLKGKDLCTKDAEDEAAAASAASAEEVPIPEDAPRCLQPGDRVAAKFLDSPMLGPHKKVMVKKKFEANAAKRLKGDIYGLFFPWDPEELFTDSFGTNWLTKAFHAAGSLPEDNSIKSIVDWKRFTGGGSGPKAIFTVEYEKEDPNLDTKLFMKEPYSLEENAQQRFLESGQAKFGDNWGGEFLFYRYLSAYCPFPVPKFYFGDINRESTEAILINACVEWPAKDKKEFGPYEVFPPAGKCEDYLLIGQPVDYYFAIFRRMGQFAGLHKAGKLGPYADTIDWMKYTPTNDVNCAPAFPGSEASAKAFIEEVAPHWFPARAKQASVMKKFCEKMADCCKNQMDIANYLYSDPNYIGLHHQNGNTDNLFFYKDANGRMEAGVLDWGSTAPLAYGTGFMGSTISALGEMLAEHDDKLIQCWCDAYHATGAPKIDDAEVLFRYRLATCVSAYGIISTLNQMVSPNVIGETKKNFKDLPSWNCEVIRANFGMQFAMGMVYNRIMLMVLKGDKYWNAIPELQKKLKK